jgi:ferritin-like metal-binding protein YciE
MAETVHDRINTYIQDTISAERNFEDALRSFGKAGVQPEVQSMLSGFSAKAATQHERLTALLEARGGKPSSGKTALAESLAFSPLSAQIGQGEAEKNTQHLMITFAAAAAEMAMYESLASAAAEAGDEQVVRLAKTLQGEEHDDYKDVWSILRQSARSAFATEVANGRTPEQIIQTYLQDAIAAEKTFENQLEDFAKEGDNQTVQALFAQHARETHTQYEELTARLNALGGSTSALKTAVAHIFGFAPKVAQIGHDAAERQTQNLMMAYAVENAEVAMYESLAEASRAAGDTATEQLALSIQQQEKATADKVWAHIGPNARQAITRVRQATTS